MANENILKRVAKTGNILNGNEEIVNQADILESSLGQKSFKVITTGTVLPDTGYVFTILEAFNGDITITTLGDVVTSFVLQNGRRLYGRFTSVQYVSGSGQIVAYNGV